MRSTCLVWLLACDPAIGRSTLSQTVAVGARPIEVAAGDLDRDGRIDLVTAHADGTIAVWRQGERGWHAAGAPMQVRAHLVALGDIDADGRLDVVTTDHDSGDVSVARGDGTGRLRAVETVRAVTVEKPHNHGLVVADLDRDGDADVVVADQVAKQLVVLISNGRTLEARAPIALPAQAYPPAAGDLDDNGTIDIVVPLIGTRAVAVLLGTGTGELAAPVTFSTTRERPYGVAIGDVDGDRLPDVVVTHDDTDTIVVMAGDGRGALVERRAIVLPGRIGTTPVLVDLDGDGALDLAGAGSDRLVRVDRKLSRIRTERTGGWRVIAADLDGDRKPDLAVPDSEAGVVRLWLSRR